MEFFVVDAVVIVIAIGMYIAHVRSDPKRQGGRARDKESS